MAAEEHRITTAARLKSERAPVNEGARNAIVTVAAHKGGVGKTTLAYELAAALDGVLIDLDFDGGGATDLWGFDPLAVARAPLLDALERGATAPPPRPKRRPNRPDLIPSHPDLSVLRIDGDKLAECLEAWACQWATRPLVIDTHPGAHWTTDGAVQIADVVLVPAPPSRRELAATRGMLREHDGYPILLVPMMVPSARGGCERSPVSRSRSRLSRFAKEWQAGACRPP